jgi:hypothetical protein
VEYEYDLNVWSHDTHILERGGEVVADKVEKTDDDKIILPSTNTLQ